LSSTTSESAPMGHFSQVEIDGRLMLVTIDRPEVHNACHPMANQELSNAFDMFESDDELWVAIITGRGEKAFCAGNDLKYHSEHYIRTGNPPEHPPKGFAGLTRRFGMNKPVIGAINGLAFGGGFEIALSCDILIASTSAVFSLPEPKVGLAAGSGGVQRLSRSIPLKLAMGMLLTGRHVSATEAAVLGILNEVVPQDELMSTARRWAQEIMACSPLSVRATKEMAMCSLDIPSLELSMRKANYPAYDRMIHSLDAVEGPRAFAEKRPPLWQGH
jgi:enoyl-CoA hydratase/carnithine racemase